MVGELKIIIGEKCMDSIVELDGNRIGFVQDIHIHISPDGTTTIVDIVFPDFSGVPTGKWYKEVQEQTYHLRQMPNVNVIFRPL